MNRKQDFRNSVHKWFSDHPENKAIIMRAYHYRQENQITLIGKIIKKRTPQEQIALDNRIREKEIERTNWRNLIFAF